MDGKQQELARFPIGSTETEEWNWALRLEIGADMTQLCQRDCGETPPALAHLYDSHPLHAFYTDAAGKAIWRLYGVAVRDDGTPLGHTCRAMLLGNNKAVGGVPLGELVRCERWSAEQLAFLRSGMVPDAGIFLDPLGFALLAE